MTEFPAALTFPLDNDAKAAIIRAAKREQAEAFAAVARAIAGAASRLFARKPGMPAGAGLAR